MIALMLMLMVCDDAMTENMLMMKYGRTTYVHEQLLIIKLFIEM